MAIECAGIWISARPAYKCNFKTRLGKSECGVIVRGMNRNFRLMALAGAALALAGGAACHHRQAMHGAAKVDALLARMTLREKIRLIHGGKESPGRYQGQAGYLAGNRRLGIPGLRLADGPPGVLTRHRSTAPTATMGLAATFSPADAFQNGVVIGRDAKALGIDVALQPFINIYRDPTWSRAYNVYGEDPLLTGEIGAGLVRGIQSQGVMAQAKHFIAYDGASNVIVGQQALHEIYAEPFAYAVRAGVSSVMCSYNQVNHAFACGNSGTLKTLLKQEIGFQGFVTSDWGATHAANFINAGLDLEMPGSEIPFLPCYFCATVPAAPKRPAGLGSLFFGSHIPEEPAQHFNFSGFEHMAQPQGMLAAVKSGAVSPARITAAARRILMQMDRFGRLRGAVKHNVTAVPFAQDLPIVEKTAEDAAVLLKDQRHILPLTAADLNSLALIGPGAGQTITIGESGEKALGFPSRDLSPLEALERATRGAAQPHFIFAVADDMTGHPIPAAYLSHAGQPGLLRMHAGKQSAVDRELNFTRKIHRALPAGSSFQWQGKLAIQRPGVYWIYLQMLGCVAQLKLDGKLVAHGSNLILHGNYTQAAQDNVLPTTDNLDNVRIALPLKAGAHALEVDETADGSGRPVQIRLNWMMPAQRRQAFAAALAAARQARTVVVFAWGRGRPAYHLPDHQDRLIAAIARLNPRTIVVLNTSQPDALPWLDQVRALLEMWYPGDGGGVATANILLGRSDPAGRLPFTWARRLTQYVSHDPAHPERSSRGVHGVTRYSEGIYVGYRWFDHKKIQPLFPFGFGLSYTRFRYTGLSVYRAPDGGLQVSFNVRNIGRHAGEEVTQVYLGSPAKVPARVQFAVRALAGFQRISLAAGQSRRVRMHVPLRQLQYWRKGGHRWRLARGRRIVYAGASSRNLSLSQAITIQ